MHARTRTESTRTINLNLICLVRCLRHIYYTRKMIIVMQGEPSLMHDVSELYDIAKETKVALFIV